MIGQTNVWREFICETCRKPGLSISRTKRIRFHPGTCAWLGQNKNQRARYAAKKARAQKKLAEPLADKPAL